MSFVGSASLLGSYIGDTAIFGAYKGSDLVWQAYPDDGKPYIVDYVGANVTSLEIEVPFVPGFEIRFQKKDSDNTQNWPLWAGLATAFYDDHVWLQRDLGGATSYVEFRAGIIDTFYTYFTESGGDYQAFVWPRGENSAGLITGGAIAPYAHANPASGYSCGRYTGNGLNGQTIAHGLGATPKFVMIIKDVKTDNNGGRTWTPLFWQPNEFAALGQQLHPEIGNPGIVGANSTFITVDNIIATNNLNEDYYYLAFAEVAGSSVFGTVNGAGGATETVNLGFEPRLLFLLGDAKAAAGSYGMYCYTKEAGQIAPYNPIIYSASADGGSSTKLTNTEVEFTSTGFTIAAGYRGNDGVGPAYYFAWA